MKRIFKYEIPIMDHFELELPLNAEILSFQSQTEKEGVLRKEKFYIWAIINDEEGLNDEKRYFRLAGTGHDITEDFPKIKKYIGTAQIGNGALVLHLFEIYKGEK